MKPSHLFLIAALVALTSCGTIKVEDLRVEHAIEPSVVDILNPRLSWVNAPVSSKSKGLSQSAYRIVVATSEKKLGRGDYDAWDTGRVESGQSVLIDYEGKPLVSAGDYYWKVMVWDQDDKPSGWSETAHWGMGLLKESDWVAKWISDGHQGIKTPEANPDWNDPANGRGGNGVPLYRKKFGIDRKIAKAKVFVSAGGYFELHINGKRVGEDYLVPNVSNYTYRDCVQYGSPGINGAFRAYRIYYLGYDVTDQLRRGDNVVAGMTGSGFYDIDRNLHTLRFGNPCFLVQLQITYADGTTEVVATDETWQTRPSAIRYTGIHGGEVYDALSETELWDEAACEETDWDNAVLGDAPTGELSGQLAPSDRITLTLGPESFEKTGEGEWEVDFGKEISGWVRFSDIEAEAGDTLRLSYLNESEIGRQIYICDGSGSESHAPRFTWFVFRKVKISGVKDLSPENLVAEAVNTDLPKAAQFSCSNELFNQINEIWRRSQEDNMHGAIASDCPHRERLPYTGDGQVAMETVMYNYDAATFYQKWIRDMRDAGDVETGYVPNTAPWIHPCGGGVPWGAAIDLMPWDFYVQYGDRKMLQDSYFSMKEYIRFMRNSIREDGTMFQQLKSVHGEKPEYWLNLGDWCPAFEFPKDDLVHTFYLWSCATRVAQAAEVLGFTDEQAVYQRLADQTREAFHKAYFDPEACSYGDNGSNVFALVMGVPQAVKPSVVETLRKEIAEEHNGHLNTGIMGTKFLFEVLSDNDLTDLAFGAMNKRDYPSYGNWIEQGATTTWEYWDGTKSRNHPMFGGGLTWFYRCLAGVRPDPKEPGFKHIIIKPCFVDGLDVYYSYDTPYGKVVSDIRDGHITVTVPVGSHATLILPDSTHDLPQGTYRF